MSIALWIIQILLLVMYGVAGGMKAFATAKAKASLDWARRRPDGLVRFIGVAEMLGALGLILPMWSGILPWLTPLAALGLALIQVLAILTVHIPDKEFRVLPANIALLILALVIVIGRWGLFAAA